MPLCQNGKTSEQVKAEDRNMGQSVRGAMLVISKMSAQDPARGGGRSGLEGGDDAGSKTEKVTGKRCEY